MNSNTNLLIPRTTADSQSSPHQSFESLPLQRWTRILSWLAVLLLPALAIVLSREFRVARGPGWLGENVDPQYAYLFNSLNVATFRHPHHVDHPGTPLQIFGALALRVVHFFNGTGTLPEDVFADPELYLNAIHWALLAVNALTLLVAGALILWITGKLIPALLIQATPLLTIRSCKEIT